MDSSSESSPTGPNAIILPLCAALVILANCVPIVLLARVKKVAACTMIVVLSVQNLFTLTNAIIWPNDNVAGWYSGIGLCDVQVSIKSALSTLLATSAAYLAIDLAKAIDTDNPRLYESGAMKRRRMIIELVFCFAIPALQVPLHYVVQASRFGVVTVFGCADVVDDSWPKIVILAMWPPIFALVNCYYAILVMHRLRKHRGALSNTLSSTGSGLNARRFLKLFFLSFSLLLVYLPVTLYFFYVNVSIPFSPFSWSRIHDPESWNPIIFYTTAVIPRLQYNGWVGVVMASFSFFLYGMNNEGIDLYKGWLVKWGFAKIFPGLLRPREGSQRGNLSRSWTSRLDVVSRAASFLDGTRHGGETSSLKTTQSHKGSGSTLEHTSSSNDGFITTSTSFDVEHIASASTSASTSTVASQPPTAEIQCPDRTHQPRPFFTPFRTHYNLPLPIFTAKKPTASTTTSSLESQAQTPVAPLDTSLNALEISISSDDDDLDPTMPRMGTRAYREREKREHELDLASTSRGVLPDTVTIDFAPLATKSSAA